MVFLNGILIQDTEIERFFEEAHEGKRELYLHTTTVLLIKEQKKLPIDFHRLDVYGRILGIINGYALNASKKSEESRERMGGSMNVVD